MRGGRANVDGGNVGLTIDQMHLSRYAREGAEILQRECPFVIFTSGRRDLDAQAKAMAENVYLDRNFVHKVYRHGAAIHAWVLENPQINTVDELHDGIYTFMLGMSDADLWTLSAHLTGDAFDVKPLVNSAGEPTLYGQKILSVMNDLPNLSAKPLTREGSLVRWHCQFVRSVEV